MYRSVLAIFIIALAVVTVRNGFAAGGREILDTRTRRPVALALVGDTLFVANQRSGSLSVVDPASGEVTVEKTLGQGLSDIASVPGSNRLLIVDERNDALLLIQSGNNRLKIVDRIIIKGSPVSIAVSQDGLWCSVASLWARRLSIVQIKPDSLQVSNTIDLPFAPRLQALLSDDKRLAITDSFGGAIAVVDTRSRELIATRTVEGNNIRGLTASRDGQSVHMSQMKIESHLPTTREMIAGGYLVGNLIRTVALKHLVDGESRPRPVAHWSLLSVGLNGKSSGDPGPLAVMSGGGRVVCLTGVHEVGIRRTRYAEMKRIAVGNGPSDVAISHDETRAYIANRFDDTVSVVDLAKEQVIDTIELGPKAEPSLSDRGERLFFDARLSVHQWYSCHSCHSDGHSAGILVDTFGDETSETPKRVLSLLGTSDTGPWAWSGTNTRLYEQIHKSLHTTMSTDEKLLNDRTAAALSAYLQTLPPPPSINAARGERADSVTLDRGRQVFIEFKCGRCHVPGFYTKAKSYDVGLRDEMGMSKFNPPSLRGLSQRNGYFHDSRARTLKEVLVDEGHNDVEGMTNQQRADLIAYLLSL